MGIPTNVITPEPLITATQESRYRSTGLELFGVGVGEGLTHTSIGTLGRMASFYAAGNEQKISENEWKQSPYYREGLKHDPSLTMSKAQILATRYDGKKRTEFLQAHVKSEFNAALLNISGNIVGFMVDPLIIGPLIFFGILFFRKRKKGWKEKKAIKIAQEKRKEIWDGY